MHILRIAAVAALIACTGSAKLSTQRISYPNGSPHFEYEMRNGVPDGTGRVWHANGELSSQGVYVNGVKHGEFTFYDDDGRFEHKAYFWKNVEVWRSTVATEKPPEQLISGLVAFSGSTPPHLGENMPTEETSTPGFQISRDPPAPYFALLDRTTGLNRVGLQFGFGAGDGTSFGSVSRLEVFGNYRVSRFGAYGQLSQARYEAVPGMTLSGRRTLEGGGTYHHSLGGIGMLTARTGLLVPVGNDDTDGFLASNAGAFQRPTDAAASFPTTAAIRTGASLTRMRERVVMQADAGVDWLAGGPNASLDALLRANAGVGFGIRSALVSAELSNTVRVSEPSRRLHAFGLGGTFWLNRMWVQTSLSLTVTGTTAITGALGYEL
jgi:hypothetical protein